MHNTRTLAVSLGLFGGLAASAAFAQIPDQGHLDLDGAPMNGAFDLHFDLDPWGWKTACYEYLCID